MPRTCLWIICLALSPLLAQTSDATLPPALERVAVIGASVSAGFRVQHPETRARLSLADFLDRMLVGEHELHDLADEIFGFDPPLTGKIMAKNARKRDPQLVVAVDFLFWFLHGNARDEAGRLEKLETGLDLLASFDCPVLVGLIPLMAESRSLARRGLPAPETLDTANKRIRAWAQEHGAVVVELDDFMARLQSGERVEVGDLALDDTGELLQADGLHTTLLGLSALGAVSLEALVAAWPELAEQVRLAPLAVAAELSAAPVGSE